VTSARGKQEARFAGRDKQMVASLCDGRAQSLAEIAVYLRMPLGVTRVIVADMVADGLLALHDPTAVRSQGDRMDLLERVLSGLRRL
jgi:hypothetical protein